MRTNARTLGCSGRLMLVARAAAIINFRCRAARHILITRIIYASERHALSEKTRRLRPTRNDLNMSREIKKAAVNGIKIQNERKKEQANLFFPHTVIYPT
jgi:hypothetical protein